LAPEARTARRAETRIAWIVARRDGSEVSPDFRALADFQRMRVLSDDVLRRGALSAYEARLDGYPPGRARREGRALVAEAWARLGDLARAEAAYRKWLAEPDLEDVAMRLAASGLARLMAATGRAGEAVRWMESAGLGEGSDAAELRRQRRRAPLRVAAWVALGLFPVVAVALGGFRAFEARRRRMLVGRFGAVSPARALAAAWVLAVPALVAIRFDEAAADSFALLGVAGASVLGVSAVVGVGLRGAAAWRRVVVAIASVAAVLGAGYLVLDRAGGLLGIGL
jgi:nitrate reductase NapE component